LIREEQEGYAIEHQYDGEGRRIARSLVSARGTGVPKLVEYEYDSDGLLVGLQAAGHRVSFVLDASGRMIRRETSNDVVETFQYDNRGRLATLSVNGQKGRSPLVKRSFRWDALGSLVEVQDSLRGGRKYTYDALDRLQAVARTGTRHVDVDGRRTSAEDTSLGAKLPRERRLWSADQESSIAPRQPIATDHYSYDGTGNLTEVSTAGGGRLVFSYAQGSKLESCGESHFAYDANGNLIEKRLGPEGASYTYDSDNQLSGVNSLKGGFTGFEYDALGRRTQKRSSSQTSLFIWDGDVLLYEEALDGDSTGEPDGTEYVYEPDTFIPVLVIRHQSGIPSVEVIHTDDLGTPSEMTGSTGNVVWHGEYDEYGRLTNNGPESLPLRFQGQYEDSETGLYYNRFRYYDADTGRYINKDPMGLFGGLNPYLYSSNPRNNVDPLGLIIVYRNLRPDEDPLKGLVAKRPGRGMTPAGHIMNGSRPSFKGSQFISTTTDPAAAARWRAAGQRQVMIDTDLIEADAKGNLRVVDVSTPAKAKAAGLKGRPYANAVSSREVLIEGRVPPRAITEC
jgi:RHS repeat-associated protein